MTDNLIRKIELAASNSVYMREDMDALENMINTITANQTTLLICLAIVIVLGVAILWNQRKIKKQLKQLLEAKEESAND